MSLGSGNPPVYELNRPFPTLLGPSEDPLRGSLVEDAPRLGWVENGSSMITQRTSKFLAGAKDLIARIFYLHSRLICWKILYLHTSSTNFNFFKFKEI